MPTILGIIFSVFAAALSTICGYKILQIFQLSSYKFSGFKTWVKQSKFDYFIRYFALAFLAFTGMLVFYGCFKDHETIKYLGLIFFALFCAVFIITILKEKKKTPLKFTYRIIRCMVVMFILYFFFYLGMIKLGDKTEMFSYSITAIGLLLIPLFVIMSHYIMLPFEKINNKSFKNRAERKLEHFPSLKKIAITGSFGKTSTKYVLAKFLEKKYNVCFSPQSYNTPMGISKVINNELNSSHEVFIAEMGARNIGDIKELALMVKPNYAIITAIGKQHLETFGTLDNIVKAKSELFENMDLNNLTVFNGEGGIVKEMYEKCGTVKMITCDKENPDCIAYYKDMTAGADGTAFTMVLNNKEYKMTTKLLGKHIPALIVTAALVAITLGVAVDEIKEAAKDLEPVPHRLELVKKSPDMIVIDDAYNSNFEGFVNALEILGTFEDYKKIIVTPGLVELGTDSKELNSKIGEEIAKKCDYAILIGINANAMKSGAAIGGMSEENIIIAASLEDGVNRLSLIEGNKAVLFENDLPDNL